MFTNMNFASLRRRDFLYGLGSSLGAVAMTDLLAKETGGPLAPKKPMHTPKAKAVIMLFMEGGPSQLDTFDPKPKLGDLHLKGFFNSDDKLSGMGSGARFYVKSPYAFRKVGNNGVAMSEHFRHMAEPAVADEPVEGGLDGLPVGRPVGRPARGLHVGRRHGLEPSARSVVAGWKVPAPTSMS